MYVGRRECDGAVHAEAYRALGSQKKLGIIGDTDQLIGRHDIDLTVSVVHQKSVEPMSQTIEADAIAKRSVITRVWELPQLSRLLMRPISAW